MCGITGLINPAKAPLSELKLNSFDSVKVLSEDLLSLLNHRGPDEMGVAYFKNSFIANARLSIVDLAHGVQPISNQDDTVWIVYNGEIYDIEIHRKNLINKGYKFKTSSDTEVVLNLYIEHGPKVVNYLNGEYAFCIFDLKKNEYFICRDFWGTKPLYVVKLPNAAWLFSSEIKPLIWATKSADISLNAFSQTVESWSIIPPETSFDNILQIPPATGWLINSNGEIQVHTQKIQDYHEDPDAQDDVYNLIESAVKKRLVADVEVGTYMSGGLDSSIVTYFAKKYSSNLKTFSITFQDKQFDESTHQAVLKNFFHTDHYSLNITTNDLAENFIPAVIASESIVFRSAFVPMFMLSKLVKDQNLKVVLTGEGADELFGGYDIYREAIFLENWAANNNDSEASNYIRKLYHYLPDFNENNIKFLTAFYKSQTSHINQTFGSHISRWKSGSQVLLRLIDNSVASKIIENINSLDSSIKEMNVIDQCRMLEIRTLLHGYLLSIQGDRMASANSIEVRIPFLDMNLAKYALSNPVKSFIHDFQEKANLYKAFSGKLPPEITSKKKQPYLSPDLEIFFSSEITNQNWRDYLSENTFQKISFLDRKKTLDFIKNIENGFQLGRLSRRDNTAFFALVSSLILAEEMPRIVANPELARMKIKRSFHMEHVS